MVIRIKNSPNCKGYIFVPIYQTILDTINNPNEISNIYQLLDNITEELNASGNNCELEFMANNQFILTTYTSNGNCIINVMPGGVVSTNVF